MPCRIRLGGRRCIRVIPKEASGQQLLDRPSDTSRTESHLRVVAGTLLEVTVKADEAGHLENDVVWLLLELRAPMPSARESAVDA